MERGDSAIRDAFAKIKEDMDKHSSNISKLSSKSNKIDKFMLDVKKDLMALRQSLERLEKKSAKPGVKQKINIPEFDKIKKDIKLVTSNQELFLELKSDVEVLKKEILVKDKNYKKDFRRIARDIVGDVKKPTLKTKMIQKFDRNKKRILTEKILGLITEKQLTLPELKSMVVDELGYCSKASFYRYFQELKKRKLIDFIAFDGTRILVVVKQKQKLG